MAGGTDADRFAFATHWGDDEINDFEVGGDQIGMFDVDGLDHFEQLTVLSVDGGTDIVWGDDTIFLANVSANQLSAATFIF